MAITDTLEVGRDLEAENFYYLHNCTTVLPDTHGTLNYQDIQSPLRQSQFIPYHSEVMRETPAVSKYWHQATIKNIHSGPLTLWYYSGSAHFFMFAKDAAQDATLSEGGVNLSFDPEGKLLPQNLFPPRQLVPIHLEAYQVKTFYWYSTYPVFQKRYSSSLAGYLCTDEYLQHRQKKVNAESINFAFVMGVIVAITTFLFIFYSIYREPAFFALALLALSSLTWYLYTKGLLFTTLLASSSYKSGGYEVGEYILTSVRVLAFYFYVVVFLRLKTIAPGWYKTFKWGTSILVGIVITDFFFRFFILPHHFQIHSLGWQMANGGIALMLVPYLGVGIHLTIRRVPMAGIYLLGNIFNVTGLIFHTLSMNFISGPLMGTIDQWGTALMLVTFSLALAIRMRSIESEKLQAETVVIQKDSDLKAAAEMDAMKTSFFTSISHEFRTPLTLIMGPLEKMYDETTEEKKRSRIDLILRNSRRMQNLINQLLDLAKLQSNKVTLQVAEHDFTKHIKTISAAHTSLAESNNVNFETHLTDDQVMLFYDREMMNKVVNNLLSNAFKYCSLEGDVIVSVIRQDETVTLQVENSGDPISTEDQERIFEHFQRLENRHHQKEGTGVGLALVKDLVSLHHGELSLTSRPGEHIRFTATFLMGWDHFQPDEILVPNDEELKDGPIPATQLDIPTDDFTSPISGKDIAQVLVLEDNEDMQCFIKEELEDTYNVATAENGRVGLESARHSIPDLIISDVMMPEMDGFTFLEKLRTDPLICHIPVIMLTALSTDEAKFKGLETGADDYLLKPFNTRELRIRVANLIRQRQRLRERFTLDQAQDLKEVTVSSMDEKFLRSIMDSIESNMADMEFGVKELSEEVYMSRSQLFRKLTALTNLSPTDFIRTQKLKRAAELLRKHAATVTEIAFMVGFQNPAHFATSFKKEYGVSPSKYSPGS